MMKKKQNKLVTIAILLVLLIAFAGFGGRFYYTSNLKPVATESEIVEFEVVEGDSISSVISRLQEQGIIKSSTISKWYAKFHSLHNLKVGFFTLDKAWDTPEILAYLNDANNAGAHQAIITFREGIWAKDIAALIETNLHIPANDLLALWNDDAYVQTLIDKYEFLDNSILNDQTKVKLEGYLYPETYSFDMDATKEEITETFLNQFRKVYDEIKGDVSASGKSMHDIITLASMVQYESKTVEDMYLISSVFENRLKIDMPLQSSVTVCYALYEAYEKAEDCEMNANIDSPYNTYMHAGLPVGPILNPGKDAILAVLHPKETDYLYFMADIYGDGTVYYAKTLEEHNANVNKYLR